MNESDVHSAYRKAEDLICRAVDEGADAEFQHVRQMMRLGVKYRSSELIFPAIAHLERAIASIRREKMRRSTRQTFIVKLKNLFRIL